MKTSYLVEIASRSSLPTGYIPPAVAIEVSDAGITITLTFSAEDWVPEEHPTIDLPRNRVIEEVHHFAFF